MPSSQACRMSLVSITPSVTAVCLTYRPTEPCNSLTIRCTLNHQVPLWYSTQSIQFTYAIYYRWATYSVHGGIQLMECSRLQNWGHGVIDDIKMTVPSAIWISNLSQSMSINGSWFRLCCGCPWLCLTPIRICFSHQFVNQIIDFFLCTSFRICSMSTCIYLSWFKLGLAALEFCVSSGV